MVQNKDNNLATHTGSNSPSLLNGFEVGDEDVTDDMDEEN
jgi:hypothetical protein